MPTLDKNQPQTWIVLSFFLLKLGVKVIVKRPYVKLELRPKVYNEVAALEAARWRKRKWISSEERAFNWQQKHAISPSISSSNNNNNSDRQCPPVIGIVFARLKIINQIGVSFSSSPFLSYCSSSSNIPLLFLSSLAKIIIHHCTCYCLSEIFDTCRKCSCRLFVCLSVCLSVCLFVCLLLFSFVIVIFVAVLYYRPHRLPTKMVGRQLHSSFGCARGLVFVAT